MRFETKDNLQLFDFSEVTVKEIEMSNTGSITFILEALIAKANNPTNEECVDRFVDIASMRFIDAEITEMFKEGFKYYDANGNLKEQVDDEIIDSADMSSIISKCKDVVLFDLISVSKEENGYVYQIGIDLNEDDTYWITISCKGSSVQWEKFMNRVMR